VPKHQKFIKQSKQDEEEEKQSSQSSINVQAGVDKYYKKFDFFYARTCFRLMSEFYKLLFQPFQKQWVEQKKKSSML
jgi:hypothetical protein